MMTAVDTNLLLDLLGPDPAFGPSSKEKLRRFSREGTLVICEVVYAEIAGAFSQRSTLDSFLDQAGIELKPSTHETLWKAGELWRRFRLDRPRHSPAPRRLLADFLVGSHASLQADQLLTRDQGFYRSTFIGLKLA